MSSNQNTTSAPSLSRIAKATAITIIAISVTAQAVGLAIAMNGGPDMHNAGFLAVYGLTSFAILPGAVLAIAMFLVNAARSFRDGEARIKAAVYLVIAAFPLFAANVISSHQRDIARAAEDPVARETESDQFLAGRDWAKENLPEKNADCVGEHEFARGCWAFLEERRKQQFAEGREWAKENQPVKASECTRPDLHLHFIVGCRNYFLEHLARPKPEGQGKYEGMTTAECKIEVNANFELAEQLYLENGNTHGAASNRRRHWIPELADCENYDKMVHNAMMPKAYSRLQQLTDRLKGGEAVTDEEKRVVLRDFTDMSGVPDQPYKKAYMEMFNEYSARIHGEHKDAAPVYPKLSCAEYQSRIDEMRHQDKQRSDAMAALKDANGVVRNSVLHASLNQQRIAALWDWKLHTDGAKAAGCDISAS